MVLVFVNAVVANLIIVRRSEGSGVRRAISLKLAVHPDLAVAVCERVEVTCARLFINKADDVAIISRVEEL